MTLPSQPVSAIARTYPEKPALPKPVLPSKIRAGAAASMVLVKAVLSPFQVHEEGWDPDFGQTRGRVPRWALVVLGGLFGPLALITTSEGFYPTTSLVLAATLFYWPVRAVLALLWFGVKAFFGADVFKRVANRYREALAEYEKDAR